MLRFYLAVLLNKILTAAGFQMSGSLLQTSADGGCLRNSPTISSQLYIYCGKGWSINWLFLKATLKQQEWCPYSYYSSIFFPKQTYFLCLLYFWKGTFLCLTALCSKIVLPILLHAVKLSPVWAPNRGKWGKATAHQTLQMDLGKQNPALPQPETSAPWPHSPSLANTPAHSTSRGALKVAKMLGCCPQGL